MALQKPVQMSSEFKPGSHCTDGVYGTGSSFCHTYDSMNSWIRIDLGSLKIITFLTIHNRVNLNDPVNYLTILERLSHTDIYVFDNEDPNDNRRLCSRIAYYCSRIPTQYFMFIFCFYNVFVKLWQ